jgi:hypothetical protein
MTRYVIAHSYLTIRAARFYTKALKSAAVLAPDVYRITVALIAAMRLNRKAYDFPVSPRDALGHATREKRLWMHLLHIMKITHWRRLQLQTRDGEM